MSERESTSTQSPPPTNVPGTGPPAADPPNYPNIKRFAKESIEALDRAIAAIDGDPVVKHLGDAARFMAKAAGADSKQAENQNPELQLMKEQVLDIYEQAVLLGAQMRDVRRQVLAMNTRFGVDPPQEETTPPAGTDSGDRPPHTDDSDDPASQASDH